MRDQFVEAFLSSAVSLPHQASNRSCLHPHLATYFLCHSLTGIFRFFVALFSFYISLIATNYGRIIALQKVIIFEKGQLLKMLCSVVYLVVRLFLGPLLDQQIHK